MMTKTSRMISRIPMIRLMRPLFMGASLLLLVVESMGM